ncbi:ABC transporter ATP-binding protein [Streptomyces sp. NPDC001982]|uniref:ABC transporter ATP-binding protein n=1 Tax=Streptomyces sp. NPDC001982 TaxID=3154405 RepID=UPI003331034C
MTSTTHDAVGEERRTTSTVGTAADTASHPNEMKLCDLTHRFRTPEGKVMTAVEDISLTVSPNEFVAIVGPSGCGKSTLLNIISGLLRPTQGQVLLGGQATNGVSRDVGYMPARDSLLPWRTCRENVEFPLELQHQGTRRERAQVATELLSAVGLEGFESHFPSALSHGMRQRVAVARTFATSPRILLMDEPFSALDAQTKIVVQDLFLKMRESRQQTVVLITHDVMEAVALADRVVVLSPRPGRIRSIHEIDLPRPRSVRHLLFDEPKFQGYLHGIWGDLDV